MEIGITWHNDQFNIDLSSKAGVEAFLSIKGCRIAQGNDGPFVSYPATKNASTGKWWRHAWGSDGFNAAVLKKAQASQQSAPAKQPRMAPDEDIPF
jgi:DNA-binding cell septation regulator SpoVG